ncbi:MAG: alpha-amylase family glycosyl hydrolase [Anaerolineaceae bacterium]|jgi:glycosidase|nr:alpha-amylase family glycosyl hydrolase [Anaerolineaceae bacterium]MDD4041946.1 alpha-amylase family glycosyl hydrolase [Anaerolineaceae bacterium]
MKEFHVTKQARDKYQFDEVLFSTNGNVIFANFHASREFAHKINQFRTDSDDFDTLASPADINALGLIDEIFHFVVGEYYKTHGREIQKDLAKFLTDRLGREKAIDTLIKFNEQLPPVAVYNGEQTIPEYLEGSDNGISNYDVTVEELLMNWLSNVNPAALRYREIFDDRPLYLNSEYAPLVDAIQVFFKTQPTFGPDDQDLVTMLRTPALMSPDSLTGQLEYIRDNWGAYLGDILLRLLGSLDLFTEEAKARSMLFAAGPDFSAGETLVPNYQYDPWGDKLIEEENFSQDSDWMPRVVMMAKNTFVWLNQLSREYQRPIERLDQVPDQTLDQLAQWGFTGLWLIGLWERSDASREIKQMTGNPDAIASAYSLARYQIADRLGGDEAYYNLSQRCGARGIRLASDMVPNHMAIDSDWVFEHPDWFIQSDQPPFPAYKFDSPDLSKRPGISINLEDHYYSRSDAAVVFKHHDHASGQTRYIYHGNDGTSMPWNDTAQLNYLMPEVREAVIQTILSVARKFPIIRFDAAMTLTKKHYQRLWFPQPGSGGDIPSRADYAMTKEAFDQVMPEEFWREVVDRVAVEVPDTLLLAEAFWLMEGYFVRTLGMHRVYNSAFMHMLRNEENEKYRQLIKNTLVYDPQILKRYVNFMNNPDEKTAVEQFGKGDKYFGICTLLSTMPGLPMFGHGQIEGYSEKYGMEYYRPYWDETPDQGLVDHHAAIIFPLLHRRKLFADVEDFRLYDFWNDDGYVDENVFAYSNYHRGQAALVIYNNRYGDSSGWIKQSAPYLVKDGNEGQLHQSDLADALQLLGNNDDFVLFRDNDSRLWFLRRLGEIRDQGMRFDLHAYSYQVLLDFQVVNGPQFTILYERLNGQGIANLEEAFEEINVSPLLQPLGAVINAQTLKGLSKPIFQDGKNKLPENLLDETMHHLWKAGKSQQDSFELEHAHQRAKELIIALSEFDSLDGKLGLAAMVSTRKGHGIAKDRLKNDPRTRYVLLIWAVLSNLASPGNKAAGQVLNSEIARRKPVAKLVRQTLAQLGFTEYETWKAAQIIQVLITDLKPFDANLTAKSLLEMWLSDPTVKDYLEVNEYNGVRWFNKESFDNFLWYQRAVRLLTFAIQQETDLSETLEAVLKQEQLLAQIAEAEEGSEYQLDRLLALLNQD